jgi:hypothetical protein
VKPSFLDKLATLRAARIEVMDAQEIAPKIRNHLLQLFRAAHAVEPTIEGIIAGNGSAIVRGEYLALYEDNDTLPTRCTNWHEDNGAQPKHPETRALLAAVAEYADNICAGGDFPYIDDITLDDLTPASAKRAKRTRVK